VATAFRSSHDGKPEPLCAIWEPRSAAVIASWLGAGQQCPRGLLGQADVALLSLRAPQALDNINTASEYAAARARLGDAASPAPEPRQLQVQYYALLREQAGRSAETVTSRARDARELFEELRAARGLTMRPEQLRVAVNEEFADWERPLAAGDTVVFLPPVAGG
jgi:molybdopterin-guanine dinucleotide biosynthesis protein A